MLLSFDVTQLRTSSIGKQPFDPDDTIDLTDSIGNLNNATNSLTLSTLSIATDSLSIGTSKNSGTPDREKSAIYLMQGPRNRDFHTNRPRPLKFGLAE